MRNNNTWITIFQSTLPAGEATHYGQHDAAYHLFQSTLPAGEATPLRRIVALASLISIHASRGGSDGFRSRPQLWTALISIHASRGGSDIITKLRNTRHRFQSTLPAGEATQFAIRLSGKRNFNPRFPRGKRPVRCVHEASLHISIHASRGGSDSTVKLSPDDRTKQHRFREPGFSSFLSAVSMLFFFWALGVRAYRIMMSLGSYPFFAPI